MKIKIVNPKKNVNAYLIVAESSARRVTLYANDYDGIVGIIFDATHGVDDIAPYCLLPEYLQKTLSEKQYSFTACNIRKKLFEILKKRYLVLY